MRSTVGKKTLHSERTEIKSEKKEDNINSKQLSKIVSIFKESKLPTLPSLPEKKEKKITWAEIMQGYILTERNLRFKLNFDLSLFEIIREV